MLRLIKNVIKYKVLRDFSIRSDAFGRPHMADLAVRFIKHNGVQGSYLEFGVFRGSTFSYFYHAFKRYQMNVSMYAFDSFKGLPQLEGLDNVAGYNRQFSAGEFNCSQSEFIAQLASNGVPSSAYTIVPGYFQESLTPALYHRINLTRVAIAWIDCDLYESTKYVLEFLRPILQDGTLLIFDDYYCFKGNPGFGERKAFADFSISNPHINFTDYAKFGRFGQTFIVHLDPFGKDGPSAQK